MDRKDTFHLQNSVGTAEWRRWRNSIDGQGFDVRYFFEKNLKQMRKNISPCSIWVVGPWVNYIVCWICRLFEILFVASNVDFHSTTVSGFLLCFAKTSTFSKSACLSASCLCFLTWYLLTVCWDFLMNLHFLFHRHPGFLLIFKDVTRSFVKLSSFLYHIIVDNLFLALLLLESASSSDDAEFLFRPSRWCFLLTHCCLIWALSKPSLPIGLPLQDLYKRTQLFYKGLAQRSAGIHLVHLCWSK